MGKPGLTEGIGHGRKSDLDQYLIFADTCVLRSAFLCPGLFSIMPLASLLTFLLVMLGFMKKTTNDS